MKKSGLLNIIREEVEVVLTNAEAIEIFDLDPAALLDEMMSEKKNPKAKSRNRPDPVFDDSSPKVKDDKDHFPINTLGRARNALARASQYSKKPAWYDGTLKSLVSRVRSKVKSKYPSIELTKASAKPGKG
jgi:hypothetical protein|tara:strand:- start:156 stop:548 length:393 start_codon:yes stop_codon:yes gene_type:complete